MILKSGFLALLVTSAFLLATPAIAGGEQCAHAKEITDLAGFVLDDLAHPQPTLGKSYGVDAAYLTLHYGNISEPEAEGLLKALIAQNVVAGRSFVQAYLISRYGYDEATQRLQSFRQTVGYGSLDTTVIRQLAKANRFDVAISALVKQTTPPDANRPLGDAMAVIDFPDADKRRFAQAAEAAGLYAMAGGIYASMGDRSDWPGYIKRNFKKPGFPRLRYTFLAFSAYHPELPPMPDPRNGRNSLMIRKYVRTDYAAGFRLPHVSLPLAYGSRIHFEPLFSAKASDKLIKLIDQGAIKPTDNMDESWLVAFREIAARIGDPRGTMEKMERIGFDGRRHLRTNAGEILNWMLAVEAIAPWLNNPGDEFPDIPDEAGESLRVNWQTWRTVGTAIEAGDLQSLDRRDEKASAIATELLFAKGDYQALTELVASVPSPWLKLRLAEDFSTRLDRLCDSRLYFPGEGVMGPAALLYDFDVAK
ncbi:hypothetical protein IHQ71_08745 [Rhizobium sp. TH2]|uniref:hypothetical protein n=1 Tax=Rhizobium sp. TH2 TaxID=2775403 RepID=UPI0021589036|nr:hypothetical protein [Rhizobium sp. TH2]UVC10654.1 hypothetical protein IHQ71_08745 [Rhizobium sp. TH2]